MNESENPIQPVNDAEVKELRDELRSLRFMFSFSLLLSFVFSFLVFVYFLRQNSVLNSQLNQQQMVISQGVEIINRLKEYSATHADFAPIFQKYSHVLNIHPSATPAKK